MSESPQVQPLPSWWWLLALGCGLPFLLGFWTFANQPMRGFVACLSVAVIICIYGLFRNFRERLSFWFGFSIVILAHFLLVFDVRWFEMPGPKIVALPFFLGDIWLSFVVIFFTTKLGHALTKVE